MELLKYIKVVLQFLVKVAAAAETEVASATIVAAVGVVLVGDSTESEKISWESLYTLLY